MFKFQSRRLVSSNPSLLWRMFLTLGQSDSLGQTTVEVPPVFTTTYTSTSNGVPLTITAVVSQATTLNTDDGGSTSPFFKNKGAVAGVFIVVGIAGAAIILFGVFTFLRRRKMNRLTREAAIAATLGSGRCVLSSLLDRV